MDLDIWRYVSHDKGQESNHWGFKLFTKADLLVNSDIPSTGSVAGNSSDGGRRGQTFKLPISVIRDEIETKETECLCST